MNIIDNLFLAPYSLVLKFRHMMFDSGMRKSHHSPVPTISVGNVTVGGTGKTPHTEMLLRILSSKTTWKESSVAVLSRGYKRKTRWFQQVVSDGTASDFGDEPVQIKRKFPEITVAVDKDRIRGCDFLANPDALKSSKKAKKCRDTDFPAADLIILDDAFQYRRLKPSLSIVLVDYRRPVFDDHLLPAGKLRDLPQRIHNADVLIVTKSPAYLENPDKQSFLKKLRMEQYDPSQSTALTDTGRQQSVFFSRICYCSPEAVFPEGDTRYIYSKSAVMVTGIADDTPFARFLSDTYKIIKRISFPDHHSFSSSDIKMLEKVAAEHPTAVFITTEKDSQRLRECKKISGSLRKKIFRIPIAVQFLTEDENDNFISLLDGIREEQHFAPAQKPHE